MREIRKSGSEGGGTVRFLLPLSVVEGLRPAAPVPLIAGTWTSLRHHLQNRYEGGICRNRADDNLHYDFRNFRQTKQVIIPDYQPILPFSLLLPLAIGGIQGPVASGTE